MTTGTHPRLVMWLKIISLVLHIQLALLCLWNKFNLFKNKIYMLSQKKTNLGAFTQWASATKWRWAERSGLSPQGPLTRLSLAALATHCSCVLGYPFPQTTQSVEAGWLLHLLLTNEKALWSTPSHFWIGRLRIVLQDGALILCKTPICWTLMFGLSWFLISSLAHDSSSRGPGALHNCHVSGRPCLLIPESILKYK